MYTYIRGLLDMAGNNTCIIKSEMLPTGTEGILHSLNNSMRFIGVGESERQIRTR